MVVEWIELIVSVFFEADLAKYEKKCMSVKSEGGGEQSHGPLIGPSNDIHNELKYDYVDNCDKSHISSYNITFPNHVLPLQNHTNENYQVSHSDHYGGAATSTSSSYDNKSAANTKHFNNLKVGIDGRDGSAKDRQQAIQSFQHSKQVKIALVGILAGSSGLDLSAAQNVVFLELPE